MLKKLSNKKKINKREDTDTCKTISITKEYQGLYS